ncbi:MAG: N-acetylmuramoyl-L-alanine amidase [Coriobacteriia bacterium]|nr:N-acetylmuramoyl-L-alanine amidase [Coriobacteriia bacterium]
MAQRSRAERLGRVRGKRKRVYIAVAAAVAVLGVAAVGIGFAAVASWGDGSAGRDEGLPASADSSETASSSRVSTPTVSVEVPDLVGMQIAEAELMLEAAGLALVRVPTPPGDSAVGCVLSHAPSGGERVARGTVVEVVYADPAAVATALNGSAAGLVVCIDPGHQAVANNGQEPVGPGATETKAKVTGGAVGVVTGQAEHVMVLALSMKIKERLERYGVTVIMTRNTADVDISNSQRAAVANEANADLFLRVHADSSTNADVRGVSTLYPGGNAWVAAISEESLRAAGLVHQEILVSTGASDRGVLARSDLAGFNYATVPSILVETGYLSNPVDDRQLADPEYQDRLADGITRGILEYLGVTQ